MTTSRLSRILAAAAFISGVGAWIWFLDRGLVLSHYDAKAHLVVARRVVDNITPGWQQIGAVWLPLPHLIQILPSQVDLLYRTGAFASFVSIASFTATVWAAARLCIAMTGSFIAATVAAALLTANANLLYLQSTPMTEPLLIGAVFLVILWLYEWVQGPNIDRMPGKLGWALFATAWTRYEAWLIIPAAIAVAAAAMLARGLGIRRTAQGIVRLASWPAAAVALFVVNSRITTGQWLVTGGFYEIDPTYNGLPVKSLIAVWWGTHRLVGYVVECVAIATAAWLLLRAFARRPAAGDLMPLAIFSAALLPFYAFVEGHPFRVRYMVVLAAGCALLAGIAVGHIRNRRGALAVAALLLAASTVEAPPWNPQAAMLAEAQWDVPRMVERRQVTDCLRRDYRDEKIVASMGSLAHYMQELSAVGFDIDEFVHEGNGAIWELALATGAARHAGWILIEEQSEGGDVLARRMREDVTFGAGMMRVCAAGGVALYRRQ